MGGRPFTRSLGHLLEESAWQHSLTTIVLIRRRGSDDAEKFAIEELPRKA